ncbi:hypothetical protein Adu01nite_06720 [Paractinoplanes durhamensis]|uniref:Uncharacterized protein n=1 Tax=Paractinoplanes durhamensis TaxID=113563 RepID=A0ABQ3YP41_9ACTN|nr:hypothetical protein Adu01nite_06720 [Actinoplanes durhamensis]
MAAGMAVTTTPGLALQTHRAPGLHATPIPGLQRRIYVATYGDPPAPPATTGFIKALTEASATFRTVGFQGARPPEQKCEEAPGPRFPRTGGPSTRSGDRI